jgi:hypothetical protein
MGIATAPWFRAFSTRREPMAFPNIATAADDVNSINIDMRKMQKQSASLMSAGLEERLASKRA